jgi:diguanylate cyclase (GGDEF)-like protein/PAS domain S-box-containing protein
MNGVLCLRTIKPSLNVILKFGQKSLKKKAGQVITPEGIFTFTTIYPLLEGQFSSEGLSQPSALSQEIVEQKKYFWKVVSYVPQSILSQEKVPYLKQALILSLIFMIFIFIICILAARAILNNKIAVAELAESEQRFRTITSELAEGLYVLDAQGKLMMMNPEAERLLGWQESELMNCSVQDVIYHPTDDNNSSQIKSQLLDTLKTGEVHRVSEDTFCRKDGHFLPVSYTAAPMYQDEEKLGVVVVFRDISSQKQMKRQLEHLATHDGLTGLKNRRELENKFKAELERAKRYNHCLSVLMTDIDHFKKVNDNYGHLAGDMVLIHFSQVLKKMTRQIDIVGRYGGEEFMIVLPETSQKSAIEVAERLRSYIAEKPIPIQRKQSISITASFGVATYQHGEQTTSQLMEAADQALYRAKEQGRNRVNSEVS